MTEAELKKHLDTAEDNPKKIAAAVLGLPEKTLRHKPSPDKWCILEILGHLADMEILYAYRIRQDARRQRPRSSRRLTLRMLGRKVWDIWNPSPPELVALYG